MAEVANPAHPTHLTYAGREIAVTERKCATLWLDTTKEAGGD